MAQIEDVIFDLEKETVQLLSNQTLNEIIPDFLPRSQQIAFGSRVAKAIVSKTKLVAEAGTGTGKTFAYLIPSLLSGKKILISTATKTLQDQLFHKDIPILLKLLKLSKRVQNLKGRGNYICLQRLELSIQNGRLTDEKTLSDALYIQTNLPRLKSGDRSELPEIKEDSAVWPHATSTADNCLNLKCSNYESCFLVKARRKAQKAHIIVINHHLYFADSHLKQESIGELLPHIEVMIFDEAHHLPAIAEQFYGKRVSTWQINDLINDILSYLSKISFSIASQAPAMVKPQGIEDLFTGLKEKWAVLLSVLFELLPKKDRFGVIDIKSPQAFNEQWQALLDFLNELREHLNALSSEGNDLINQYHERLETLFNTFSDWLRPNAKTVFWIERFRQHFAFNQTPLDIKNRFSASLKPSTAFVFTSATLSVCNKFDNFINILGLEGVETCLMESPFDYVNQGLYYLPRSLPDPKNNHYYSALVSRILPIINAFKGRTFFLFTSHKALKETADLLKENLAFTLLIQGLEAKSILLEKFRASNNAVLLGTATFWEGIDVKGEALSCVIIDKIPFASPVCPVIRGKMSYFREQGRSGFDEFLLPNAIIDLKQGVGRLIRDVQDRGIVVLADPRITSRDYGKLIFLSIPRMFKTRSELRALNFIETLFKYESISL